MTFRDLPWEERENVLGDTAESQFEKWATSIPLGFVRFGLQRPPLQMHMLPTRIRYTPDYLMSKKFVEVQGFGIDQTIKLKVDKANALHWWNDVHPVEIFLWDSHHQRSTLVPLSVLDSVLGSGQVELRTFSEGKPYFSIPANLVFGYA